MKRAMINNAFFRLLAPPIYGVLVYFILLLINNEVSNVGNTFSEQEVYVCIGLTYLLSESLRILAAFLNKSQALRSSIVTHLFAGMVISILITSASISAYFEYVLGFSIANSQLISFNIIFAFSSLLYNLLFLSQLYLQKENKRHLKEENMLTETLEKQLSQFKHEVNPQLLYDSLETLITLVHKNTEESEDYIDELSAVYRYILSNRNSEFATVSEELKIVNSIVNLLNYKFANGITVKINLPPNVLESPMIPGTLPNLVEGVIRKTIVNQNSPLNIELLYEEDDDYVVLQHKANDRLDIKKSNIISDIQNTYSVYTEKPVVEIKAYDQQYIKVPLPKVIEEPLSSKSVTVS